MPVALIPIFCIAKVSAETLTELLQDAYSEGPDSPDSLLLVYDKTTLPEANEGKKLDATVPPVSSPPTSDFHGATIADLVTHVQENTKKGGRVSERYFLVADEQTTDDKTVGLIKCPTKQFKGGDNNLWEIIDDFESVRLASNQANAPVVAMLVGSGSIDELKSNVDEDGVYRGSTRVPPKKGGPAPKKKLGE